ncbi:sodium/substrate symporter small subunit [Aliarcobacter lanthieri]|uniref:sodium/substrate symporter small subunit n=1 Tax=Aliarcobacter lanthieri TaxID=1355374 RepID=UPI003AAF3894
MYNQEIRQDLFKNNIIIILKFIIPFFIFSLGFGIIFIDFFNQLEIFGTKLGYFISSQLTIYISILTVFIYNKKISQIETKYEIIQ